MKLSIKDGWYQAIRITGPTHNYLGLKFSNNIPSDIEVERKFAVDHVDRVRSDDVLKQVKSVVRLLQEEKIEGPHIIAINYCSDDTPSDKAYEILAHFILSECRLFR